MEKASSLPGGDCQRGFQEAYQEALLLKLVGSYVPTRGSGTLNAAILRAKCLLLLEI